MVQVAYYNHPDDLIQLKSFWMAINPLPNTQISGRKFNILILLNRFVIRNIKDRAATLKNNQRTSNIEVLKRGRNYSF